MSKNEKTPTSNAPQTESMKPKPGTSKPSGGVGGTKTVKSPTTGNKGGKFNPGKGKGATKGK